MPYFPGCFKPLLTDLAALSKTGFAATLPITTRRGPLIVDDDLACSTVLVLEMGLSLGPSEIRTRRGPSPDTGTWLNDDRTLVFFTSLMDRGSSTFFSLINREPSSGGDCRKVDRDIGKFAVGTAGTLEVRLEPPVIAVEPDIRGTGLVLLTILSAGTGGGGGCKLRLEEFGVDKTFGSSTSEVGIALAIRTRVVDPLYDAPSWPRATSPFVRSKIGIPRLKFSTHHHSQLPARVYVRVALYWPRLAVEHVLQT